VKRAGRLDIAAHRGYGAPCGGSRIENPGQEEEGIVRRLFALVAAATALCVLGVGTARAIVGGTLDNGGHPYAVLLKIARVDGSFERCSGVLVNGTKVITAAHCLDGATAVGVYFGGGPVTTEAPDAFSTGWAIEPGYVGLDVKNKVDTHDLAVISLDRSYTPPIQAKVAPPGYTDTFAKKSTFTVVGFGIQSVRPLVQERTRYEATSDLKNAKDPYNLRFTAKGGGACFGDSGGPVLDGDTVVAIVSFGQNNNCTSSYYAYRLDTAESQAFLASLGAV
jgi:secreted trypsin-like serine protease